MDIKLLVACRDPIAESLAASIAGIPGGQIVAEATDVAGALHRTATLRPDVLMIEHGGVAPARTWKVLAELQRLSPQTRTLILCDAYSHETTIGAIEHGAKGCLLKSSGPLLCAKAVMMVHGGETWFGRTALLEALRAQMVHGAPPQPTPIPNGETLTRREREILSYAARGMSNKEIAQALDISHATVKTHLHKIYVKLETSGRYKLLLPKLSRTAPYQLQ